MAQETTRRPTTPGVSSQPPSRPARRRAVVSPRRRSSVVGRNIRRGRAQLALTLEAASKPSEAQAIYNELAKSPVADIAKNAKQLLFGFEAMEQLGVKGSGSWQARRRTDPKHVSFIDRVRLVRTSPNPRVWLGRRRRSVRAALFWVAVSILVRRRVCRAALHLGVANRSTSENTKWWLSPRARGAARRRCAGLGRGARLCGSHADELCLGVPRGGRQRVRRRRRRRRAPDGPRGGRGSGGIRVAPASARRPGRLTTPWRRVQCPAARTRAASSSPCRGVCVTARDDDAARRVSE